MEEVKIKKKRGRKPKNKKYFGELEENAVIEYIKTNSHEVKHKIYNDVLRIPFKKMTSSILRTYNHHIGNYDIMEVEMDGLSHLIENMIKFRPYIIEYQSNDTDNTEKWIKHRKFKYLDESEAKEKLKELEDLNDGFTYRIFYATAYAYCGTIIRNFYKDHSKNSRNEIINNIYIENIDCNFDEDIRFSYEEDFHTEHEDSTLKTFNNLIECIENTIKEDVNLTNKEVIVGKGIIEIFKNWEKLFLEHTEKGVYDKKITNNFAKNKILFYLKEITKMEMKEIRLYMRKYKDLYELVKEES